MKRVALGVVVVLAALVAAGAVYWYWVPLHRAAYVRADERVLRSVPVFPGAREIGRSIDTYDAGCDLICVTPQRKLGVRIEVTYRVPKGTTAVEVVRHYAALLREWRRDPYGEPVPSLADFRRGRVDFYVDAQDLTPPLYYGDFTITVDAAVVEPS